MGGRPLGATVGRVRRPSTGGIRPALVAVRGWRCLPARLGFRWGLGRGGRGSGFCLVREGPGGRGGGSGGCIGVVGVGAAPGLGSRRRLHWARPRSGGTGGSTPDPVGGGGLPEGGASTLDGAGGPCALVWGLNPGRGLGHGAWAPLPERAARGACPRGSKGGPPSPAGGGRRGVTPVWGWLSREGDVA